MRAIKTILFTLPFLLLSSSILLAGQVANYEFQNSLTDSTGNAASLVDLGSGSYISDTVFGEQCTVFDYAEQTGLSLDVSGLFGSSAYSFAALMRLDELRTSSYAKILDIHNRNLDEGLYSYESGLVYYDYSNNGLSQLHSGVWAKVVFAYDGAMLRGYVDGVEAFAVSDTETIGGITSSTLYIFRDDIDTDDDENSAGRVANIQLFDHALSAQEAADLTFSCGSVVEPQDQSIISFIVAPSTGVVGDSSALSATASSGLTVIFASDTPAVCTVAGSTVSYLTAGACTVTADQPGDDVYNPAPQVFRNIPVDDEVTPPPQPGTPSEPIPTISTWGKIAMVFVLMLAGVGYSRRLKK